MDMFCKTYIGTILCYIWMFLSCNTRIIKSEQLIGSYRRQFVPNNGTFLDEVLVRSLSRCAAFCQKTQSCVAFNYIKSTPEGVARCHMFADVTACYPGSIILWTGIFISYFKFI